MTSNMEPRKSVAEMLDTIKCDPVAIMAEMALGETPCGRCRGVGRTKFQRSCLKDGKERTCEDCNGSGKERITPELRAKMTRELAQYVSPSTLAGPATEKMLDLLKSGDAVACQAAKAIVERLEGSPPPRITFRRWSRGPSSTLWRNRGSAPRSRR